MYSNPSNQLLETAEVTPSFYGGLLSPWNSTHHVKKVTPTISAIGTHTFFFCLVVSTPYEKY
jgi:hypothetical protein